MSVAEFNYKKLILQLLSVNFSSAVMATAFTATGAGLKIAFSAESLASSFVYGNCIGTLVCIAILFLNKYWNRGSMLSRLAMVSLLIFVATFLGVTIARLILSLFFPYLAARGIIPSWQNFVFSLGLGFTFGFAYYFYELSQAKLAQTESELRLKELSEEKAKTLAKEAQLASLESRIHPHFLFNTLNSIAALIREEPVLAEKMVERLSSLLRYSLDSNARTLVSLEQELDITQKYLEIEKVRFDEKLQYKIETEGDFLQIQIPPLALQTLVENSIKHVASKTSSTTEINVSVRENGTGVIIEVRDSGASFSINDVQEGHGLDILQKRLATIFQDKAELQIDEKGSVKLKLPQGN